MLLIMYFKKFIIEKYQSWTSPFTPNEYKMLPPIQDLNQSRKKRKTGKV